MSHWNHLSFDCHSLMHSGTMSIKFNLERIISLISKVMSCPCVMAYSLKTTSTHKHTHVYMTNNFFSLLFRTPLDIKSYFHTFLRGPWKTKCKFSIFLWWLGGYFLSLTQILPPWGCWLAILPEGVVNRVRNRSAFHHLHYFPAWDNLQ